MKLLIVGIDPGTTIGYSVLDLNGNILRIGSSKQLDLSSLISLVIDIGRPFIIGCDVFPAPNFVEKFATKTGSKIIGPDQDLTQQEKSQIVYGIKTKNTHQKDSLASAFYAFRAIKPLFNKIDRYLEQHEKLNLSDEVKELVVKKNISISSAVSILEKPEEESQIIRKVLEKKELLESDFIRLYEKLKQAEKDNSILRQHNNNLRSRAESLETKNKKLVFKLAKLVPKDKIPHKIYLKEKTIVNLDKEILQKKEAIRNLQQEIIDLNSMISKINSKNILVKRLNTLGYEELESKKEKLNILKGDILLVDDAAAFSKKSIDFLKDKVSLIIAKKSSKKLPFSTIDASKLDIHENALFALVDKKQLESELSKQDMLSRIVDEYKRERD